MEHHKWKVTFYKEDSPCIRIPETAKKEKMQNKGQYFNEAAWLVKSKRTSLILIVNE